MRRIVSLICAITLTLAGTILVYIELAWPHPHPIPGKLIWPHPHPIPGKLIMVAVLMLGAGLLWLASEIKQWRK
jgi:hypothetical protein